jgi:LacI family transcriptional regulator
MVTQAEIALKLGVSRQLVTFALAGYPQVAAKSRQRILATARRLGYKPNPFALALKRGRTGIIALWIPEQISNHYSHVARELNRLAKESGHELIISEVSDVKAERVLFQVPVDGIIAVDVPNQVADYLKTVPTRAVPVVAIGTECPAKMDSVWVDLLSGAEVVMRHLLGLGYRRIAHATFVRGDSARESRRSGYVTAMRKAGLPTEFIYYPLTREQRPIIRQLIQKYIRKHGCPEAIFCHSDDIALGIYRGLCDMNLRIPTDVALVGCDGIQDTEYLECPLTTLAQPVSKMCASGWKFLKQRLDNPKLKRQKLLFEPKLIVRGSTRCAVVPGSSKLARA